MAKSLLVEISDVRLKEFSGTSKGTQKPYCFFKQKAYLFTTDAKYPTPIELTHDENNPLGVGRYHVDLNQAVSIDNFGGLGIDARLIEFVPVPDSK
jgi:hypothetical protein